VLIVYAASGSKKFAEEAAWDFVKNDASFTLSTINPMMVYGPIFPGSVTLNHLGTSAADIYRLMNGSLEEVPDDRLPAYTDVRDVADAHRLAYEAEQTGRFPVCSDSFTYAKICRLFRDSGLGLETRVPSKGLDKDKGEGIYTVDSSNAKKLLGWTSRSFDETFLDMAKAFLAMEKDDKNSSQL
jgi:nucleoside-diphosphate-sugar epimerase